MTVARAISSPMPTSCRGRIRAASCRDLRSPQSTSEQLRRAYTPEVTSGGELRAQYRPSPKTPRLRGSRGSGGARGPAVGLRVRSRGSGRGLSEKGASTNADHRARPRPADATAVARTAGSNAGSRTPRAAGRTLARFLPRYAPNSTIRVTAGAPQSSEAPRTLRTGGPSRSGEGSDPTPLCSRRKSCRGCGRHRFQRSPWPPDSLSTAASLIRLGTSTAHAGDPEITGLMASLGMRGPAHGPFGPS